MLKCLSAPIPQQLLFVVFLCFNFGMVACFSMSFTFSHILLFSVVVLFSFISFVCFCVSPVLVCYACSLTLS